MFDILFILLVLVTVIVLLTALVNLIRRRFATVGHLLLLHGLVLTLYALALVIVSLTSPQRVVAMNEDRCFDDWCVTIKDVELHDELAGTRPNGIFYVITLELSNHSRGRTQRASSAAVHLFDAQGNRYNLSLEGQAAYETKYGTISPLTLTIEAGESYVTYQVFDLPDDLGDVTLTVEHPVGFSPGWFVIGDESSFFHKPTIVRLP